ncbi:diacylglycerol/lipid kinase family protein [Fimbriimonas ginsengisoli]|nr:diacylglycerol kinase family protein [Fimbriimonas ginsengisoli]
MNDRAGRFKSTVSTDEMSKLLKHLDLNIAVVGTKSEAHMIAVLKELVAKRADRVALAGGDGTIHTAIQVLAGTQTSMGIVPQGTQNNFATALRLPQDLPSALRTLIEGEPLPVDLGYGCGMYFAESAGVGLFANALALYGADANKNLIRGMYAIFKIVTNLRASRIRLTVDGELINEPAVFCAAMNTYRFAQSLPIAPSAKVTDGLLDVVVLGDLHRNELIGYYRAIRKQLHVMLPKTRIIQAKSVKIESRRPLPVHVDDKIRGATPVTLECRPGILKVIVERL